MITVLVRRVLPLVALAGLMAGFMRPQRVPPPTADLWFHLRFGREFLDGWSVRHPGHLGPFDSADWVPTQWLPQVAMAWTEEHVGLAGVLWATGALVLLLIALLYGTCRHLAPPLPAAIAVVAGSLAASPGFSSRPQLLSYLFVVVTVAAWTATWRDGRARYWLVLVAWAWPLCHGMWPVGISISVAAVCGLALERRGDRAALLRLAAIPVASALVAVLTPVGLGTYRSLLAVGSRSSYFGEWGPPDFTEPVAAVLALMLVVVVASGMRAPVESWFVVALTVLAVAWSLYSLRTTVVGALVLTPLLARALARLVPAEEPAGRRERAVPLVMAGVACLALWPLVQSRADEQVVPGWVDRRLDALPAGTRVLDDWDTGSWFLHRHPDLALVMHGYGDVFTDAELERNVDLVGLRPGWDEELAALDVDVALLDPGSALGHQLAERDGWRVVEADDDFVLLLPPA